MRGDVQEIVSKSDNHVSVHLRKKLKLSKYWVFERESVKVTMCFMFILCARFSNQRNLPIFFFFFCKQKWLVQSKLNYHKTSKLGKGVTVKQAHNKMGQQAGSKESSLTALLCVHPLPHVQSRSIQKG